MTIPYTSLFDKFRELADDLIEVVNATPVILYYTPAQLTSVSGAAINGPGGHKPNIFDRFGGRVPVQSLPGREQEAGYNLAEIVTTGSIVARVYWKNTPNNKDADIGIKDIKNSCKMITYVEHEQSLLNASYALIDGDKCKLVSDPVPYGLGERMYIESHWEVIE